MHAEDAPPQNTPGRYDIRYIDAGHSGHFAVESEPGRTVVLSRGDTITLSDGSPHFNAKSRLILDARDIPRLVHALSWAAKNSATPVACPNGCTGNAGCSQCP